MKELKCSKMMNTISSEPFKFMRICSAKELKVAKKSIQFIRKMDLQILVPFILDSHKMI